MATRKRRFRLDELPEGGAGLQDQVDILGVARALEWVAADDEVIPHTGFADRVMASIAAEPSPRPLAAAIGAIRARRPRAAFGALADLWRVAWTGGRPLVVRAPALGLATMLLIGSLAVGALGAGAAITVLGLRGPAPNPVASSGPSLFGSYVPAPSPSEEASESPLEPPESPADQSPASAEPSPAVSQTPESTAEGGGGTVPATPRTTPRPTERPTRSPDRTETPEPTDTPWTTPSASWSAQPSQHD